MLPLPAIDGRTEMRTNKTAVEYDLCILKNPQSSQKTQRLSVFLVPASPRQVLIFNAKTWTLFSNPRPCGDRINRNSLFPDCTAKNEYPARLHFMESLLLHPQILLAGLTSKQLHPCHSAFENSVCRDRPGFLVNTQTVPHKSNMTSITRCTFS